MKLLDTFKSAFCGAGLKPKPTSAGQNGAPLSITVEPPPGLLAENVRRAGRLHDWMSDPDVKSRIGKMERLPSVPVLYNQVVTELGRPEGSINFVGKLISKDPAMTAKILQGVNSPVFGLSRQINDPVEAVMYLGTDEVVDPRGRGQPAI